MEQHRPIDAAGAEHGPVDPDLPHSPPASHAALAPSVLFAVLLGGALGTAVRSLVSVHLPSPSAIPWKLWCVNASGALLLGLLATLLEAYRAPDPLRLFTTAGLLGGWTTYSAIAATTIHAGHAGHLLLGLTYAITGLAFAILGALLGRLIAHAWTRSR